jgi:pilus assembly protein Flp/PilA
VQPQHVESVNRKRRKEGLREWSTKAATKTFASAYGSRRCSPQHVPPFRKTRRKGEMVLTKAYSLWLTIRERIEDEEGQAMVEYALILALVSIVSIIVLQALGVDIKGVFKTVQSSVSNANINGPTP